MNDPSDARTQLKRRRRLGVAGRTGCNPGTGRSELGSGRRVDSSVDAPATAKGLVRRRDDRVHRLLGDVAPDEVDSQSSTLLT